MADANVLEFNELNNFNNLNFFKIKSTILIKQFLYDFIL